MWGGGRVGCVVRGGVRGGIRGGVRGRREGLGESAPLCVRSSSSK